MIAKWWHSAGVVELIVLLMEGSVGSHTGSLLCGGDDELARY